MKKVLITGITGFAGSHLQEYLSENKDLTIFGTNFAPGKTTQKNIYTLDLGDKKATEKLVMDIRPDYIFHLAALASPAKSFSDPYATIDNNIKAEINLLEAVRIICPSAGILIVGSGDEYGLVKKEENPIAENQPFKPTSPYSVSKIAQDMLGYQYFLSYKIPIIRVRPFNHIGPRQSPQFVVSSFARQIAEIEAGTKKAEIEVGNLTSIRDFTDVSDMVRAYWLAVTAGEPGEVYNIGSGHGYEMKEILNILLSQARKKIKIRTDKKRMRPSDNPALICNAEKFCNMSGWQPKIPIEESLNKVLNYWRLEIQKGVI